MKRKIIFFLKEMYIFNLASVHWIDQSDSKHIYVTKDFYFKSILYKNIKQRNRLTLIIIRNVSWASNPHIRVISEGSCDTEDWSNDAENHRNKLHFNIHIFM